MEAVPAFPLSWPAGKGRTPPHKTQRSPFGDFTLAEARDGLQRELRLMGASSVVLSTNVELRRDGLPYSGRRQPDDPGVAVYFRRGGKSLCMTCDRWDRVEANIRAVTKTVEAIRGIERWGSKDMVDAAFTGFAALPAHAGPGEQPWHRVLLVPSDAAADAVHAAWRRLFAENHPDRNPGDEAAAARLAEIDLAYAAFKLERGL